MGSDEDPRDYDESRMIFKYLFMAMEAAGVLMVLLTLSWILFFNGGLSWGTNPATEINLHIALMIMFMIYLQGHAALMFRLFPIEEKQKIKLLHACMHLTTMVAVIIALTSAVRAHNMKAQVHFYSLHSWIGLGAILMFLTQAIVGTCSFLLPWAPNRVRAILIPYHRFFGPVIFILSCFAGGTGFMLKAMGTFGPEYSELKPTALILNFAGISLVVFATIGIYLLTEHKHRRRPKPEGEMLLEETDTERTNLQ